MLVYHAGDKIHGVSKVESGIRYTLTSFIRGKNDIDITKGLGV
jgi:hypothetical protein